MAAIPISDRRIEVYLTNFATAYKQGEWLADFIAPPFKVKKSSDKYTVRTKRDFRIYDNKIKGREKAKEIDIQVDEATYTCEEYSLSTFLSDRDLRNMEGVGTIRLKEDKIKHLVDQQMNSREKRVFDIVGSNSVITQTADKAGAWSTAASGTPVTDIITGMKSIETNSGMKPNAIIMSYEVAMTAITTDEWKDYFKYSGVGFDKGLWSAIDGLKHLGLEPRITGARGLSTYEGTSSDPAWELMFDEKTLIFYRETSPTPRSNTLMFSPFTEYKKIESYRVNGERGTRYDIYEEIDELLVNAECGYLITDCI